MKAHTLSALMLAIATPGTVLADVSFNGFASIRATSLDADTEHSPYSRYDGDGQVSFKEDSLFALQATSDLGNGLSATVQLLAEGSNDFDMEAEWAYLSYDLSAPIGSHTLIAGRFANPLFYQSQYQKVGFAHNFARLPKAVYADFEFDTLDGLSLTSSWDVMTLTLDTQVVYGSTESDDFGIDDEIGLGIALAGDWWKIFGGYLQAEFQGESVDVVLVDGVKPLLDASGVSPADQMIFNEAISTHENDTSYWYVGFDIDIGNLMLDAEMVEYGVDDSIIEVTTAWFAAVGYRFNDVIATVHYEETEEEEDLEFLGGITDPTSRAIGTLVHKSRVDTFRDGYGITIRYDFHPSAAFKVDYFKGDDDSLGNPVGDYDIWSAGVDVVF